MVGVERGVSKSKVDTVAEHVRRRVLDELDEAALSLSLVDLDPVRSVHETRLHITTVRAALRLLKQADVDRFRREDLVLAEAARRLGPIRDRHVAQHLVTRQGRWPGDLVPPPLAPSVRARVSETGMAILGSRNRATRWDLGMLGSADVARELDRSYRQSRRRWSRSIDRLETDDLHQCRTSVRRLTSQVVLLSDSLAASKRIADLRVLDERLGQLQDLSLVPDHDRHEQSELESQILDLGTAVFALSPKQQRSWINAELGARGNASK